MSEPKSFRLENGRLVLEVTGKAGEMTSLFDKKKNRELLYQGDQGWSGRNPSLFPMVGKTWKDGSYEIDGKTYTMKNHGLIRYENLDGKTEGNQIILWLDSNEETRSRYPYDFHFEMKYTLLEDGVRVDYAITNTSDRKMPFSFGLHPAFRTSQNAEEAFEDFRLEFSPKGEATQIVFFADKSPVKRMPVSLDAWQLSRKDLEEYSTLVYENAPATSAVLSFKDEPRVKMNFEGYPYLALWSSENESDFVCIEPWFGHSDFEKAEVPFEKREGTQILDPGQTFTASYSIEAL